jgi:putative sterol carrier protein
VAQQAGTCQFGHDPATSVLDASCRAHQCDNLYVVDTSFAPSGGAVNPALTAMVNARRVGAHLTEGSDENNVPRATPCPRVHKEQQMTPASTRRGPRSDPTAAFLQDLVAQGHQPLLHKTTGTIRLDLRDDTAVEHWLITVTKGTIALSPNDGRADAVMRTEKRTFDGMAKGAVNSTAALLRGALEIEGDLALVTSFARLFPGPTQSRASFLDRQNERAG